MVYVDISVTVLVIGAVLVVMGPFVFARYVGARAVQALDAHLGALATLIGTADGAGVVAIAVLAQYLDIARFFAQPKTDRGVLAQ